MQLQRCARDVFHLGHCHEISQMPQFHCREVVCLLVMLRQETESFSNCCSRWHRDLVKAIRIHNYGGPEALQYENAPRPIAQAGEVLIRVHATSVNPIDWKVRAGYMRGLIPHSFPLI